MRLPADRSAGRSRSRPRGAARDGTRHRGPTRRSWVVVYDPRAGGAVAPCSGPCRSRPEPSTHPHPQGRAGTTALHRSPRGARTPSDQANLPAQEAPPRQGARLPCAHEVAGRSQGARRAARPWPPEAHRLTAGPPIRVPCQPLRSRRDFDRIQSLGRSRSGRLMVVRFVPNGRDHDRVGISTGRRLGGAVVRNTVRRRIRESSVRCDALLRTPGAPLSGRDILIVARPAERRTPHSTSSTAALRRRSCARSRSRRPSAMP